MKNLMRAEVLKLRTTRMFSWSALAALVLVPISVAAAILTAGRSDGGPALDTSEGIRNVFSAASSGTVVVLIIGILIMAGEFRHNTATSTFLITPDRKRVVVAKLVASAGAGAAIALAASVLTLAIALPWLAAKDVDVSLVSGNVGLVLLGAGSSCDGTWHERRRDCREEAERRGRRTGMNSTPAGGTVTDRPGPGDVWHGFGIAAATRRHPSTNRRRRPSHDQSDGH